MRYTYSYRETGQTEQHVDPDALLDLLADDLIVTGDVQASLERLLQRQLEDVAGSAAGLDQLMNNVEAMGRQESEPYELARTLTDFCRRIQTALEQEIVFRAEAALQTAGTTSSNGRTPVDGGSQLSGQVLERLPDAASNQLQQFASREFLSHASGEAIQGMLDVLREAGSQRDPSNSHLSASGAVQVRSDRLADVPSAPSESMEEMRDCGLSSGPRTPGCPDDAAVTRDDALRLCRRLQDLLEPESRRTRSTEAGSWAADCSEMFQLIMEQLKGPATNKLESLIRSLDDAGYIAQGTGRPELTPRGIRKIGEKVLRDVFRRLRQGGPGRHSLERSGIGIDRDEFTRPYAFGDAFVPDMSKSLLNAIARGGASVPLRLNHSDFEMFTTEQQTRCSTVLLLDMSPSMPLRGCFVAAKRVAFALYSLIRLRFPEDRLVIVGFSEHARELQPAALHGLSQGEYVYGTNMQHAFMLARKLLGRHHSETKQIILVTDGEPTAHFEGDKVLFSYPPTMHTFKETLREVQQCTRERIQINTFMLEKSHHLTDFVDEMTRINGGRAFYASPDNLGDYVLVDYVNSKRVASRARTPVRELSPISESRA